LSIFVSKFCDFTRAVDLNKKKELIPTLFLNLYNFPKKCFINSAIEMEIDRERANAWSHLVIGAAIEVHRIKGPGLIKSIDSKCFLRECDLRSIPVRRELLVPIEYQGFVFEEPLRLDFLVDDILILEFKVVEEVLPVHKAQLLSYMKLLDTPVGLLINFHEILLQNGIHRMIL
jgi:GxxExxY protein